MLPDARADRPGLEIGFGGVPIDDPDLLLYAADRGINYRHLALSAAPPRRRSAAFLRRRDRSVTTVVSAPARKPAKASFLDSLDGSLKRLRTDRVDVVLNHEVGRSSDGEGYARLENPEMYEAFETAKQAGKVRFLGASGHDGDLQEVMTKAVDSGRFDVLLCPRFSTTRSSRS
jgi:predicted aldo/keto reductase-like oxidoreductase